MHDYDNLQLVIAAIWCRGDRQRLALLEMHARGLTLSEWQQQMAGLLPLGSVPREWDDHRELPTDEKGRAYL